MQVIICIFALNLKAKNKPKLIETEIKNKTWNLQKLQKKFSIS